MFVLLLLKDPVVGLPSLSFSWFSQSMFNDLQEGGKKEQEGAKSRRVGWVLDISNQDLKSMHTVKLGCLISTVTELQTKTPEK